MDRPSEVVVLITAESRGEALKLSKELLDRKKAACINIVPRVESLFTWNGKIDCEDEALLVVKTRASVLDELTALVKELHSYDVPEVIALPIIGGNEDYLKWVRDEVE